MAVVGLAAVAMSVSMAVFVAMFVVVFGRRPMLVAVFVAMALPIALRRRNVAVLMLCLRIIRAFAPAAGATAPGGFMFTLFDRR